MLSDTPDSLFNKRNSLISKYSMKHLLLVFFLLPLYASACMCDPPPVALEFLKSKYIFYGTVIDKQYSADSLTYTVTFKIDKHFKKNKKNPETLSFKLTAEGEFTGQYTSCDFHVDKGENWLVYANQYNGELTFSFYCSNSSPYSSLDDVSQEKLEILENGHKIDLNKIIFTIFASRVLRLEDYSPPKPTLSLDTLLARIDKKHYENIDESHFENFVINVDSKGKVKITAVHRKLKHFEMKKVYDVIYPEYTSLDSLNTELQNAIIREMKKGKNWEPATFLGNKVNSQVLLNVYFRNNRPTASQIM